MKKTKPTNFMTSLPSAALSPKPICSYWRHKSLNMGHKYILSHKVKKRGSNNILNLLFCSLHILSFHTQRILTLLRPKNRRIDHNVYWRKLREFVTCIFKCVTRNYRSETSRACCCVDGHCMCEARSSVHTWACREIMQQKVRGKQRRLSLINLLTALCSCRHSLAVRDNGASRSCQPLWVVRVFFFLRNLLADNQDLSKSTQTHPTYWL